jgi:UPF0716 protein FxsA
MFARLALLFLIVPLVELGLLMFLADSTDWKVALLLVVATGLAGAWLVKHQGWRALGRIRSEIQAGQLPGDALVDGLLVLVAGILLLTPGILTDLAALGLLLPFSRRLVKTRLVAWFKSRWTLTTSLGAGQGGSHAFTPTDPLTFDAPSRRV